MGAIVCKEFRHLIGLDSPNIKKYKKYRKKYPNTFKKYEKYITSFKPDEIDKIMEYVDLSYYNDDNGKEQYYPTFYIFKTIYNIREECYRQRALKDINDKSYLALEFIEEFEELQSDPPSFDGDIKFSRFDVIQMSW